MSSVSDQPKHEEPLPVWALPFPDGSKLTMTVNRDAVITVSAYDQAGNLAWSHEYTDREAQP